MTIKEYQATLMNPLISYIRKNHKNLSDTELCKTVKVVRFMDSLGHEAIDPTYISSTIDELYYIGYRVERATQYHLSRHFNGFRYEDFIKFLDNQLIYIPTEGDVPTFEKPLVCFKEAYNLQDFYELENANTPIEKLMVIDKYLFTIGGGYSIDESGLLRSRWESHGFYDWERAELKSDFVEMVKEIISNPEIKKLFDKIEPLIIEDDKYRELNKNFKIEHKKSLIEVYSKNGIPFFWGGIANDVFNGAKIQNSFMEGLIYACEYIVSTEIVPRHEQDVLANRESKINAKEFLEIYSG
jgi:hypothetical protein